MSDNLRIWEAVSKTNPAHTKRVNQRGGFTAISAHYQILAATEQFGPIGEGWGYEAGDPILTEGLIFVPVTLWHGSRDNKFGPMFGGAEWKDGKGRIDSDAAKKATTDGLTKLLSQLGFNADVFLGMFDDNKYVESVRREFAQADTAPRQNGGGSIQAGGPDGIDLKAHWTDWAKAQTEMFKAATRTDLAEWQELNREKASVCLKYAPKAHARMMELFDLRLDDICIAEGPKPEASIIAAG